MFMPCMYVKTLFDLVGLRGVGVLTCMTNPEARDIWSLPYFGLWYPHAIIRMCSAEGVGPQYELLVVWDTGVRK